MSFCISFTPVFPDNSVQLTINTAGQVIIRSDLGYVNFTTEVTVTNADIELKYSMDVHVIRECTVLVSGTLLFLKS